MPIDRIVVQRVLKLLLGASAVSGFVWTFLTPRFRDIEGFLRGEICLPIAASAALAILAYSMGRPHAKAAFWFALALVGQAVALQMIEAGQLIRYQHYRSLGRLVTETNPILIGYLAIQTVLVAAGLWTSYPRVRAWIAGNFKSWKLAALGTVFVLSSVALSRDVWAYLAELPLAVLVQAVNLANIVVAVMALPVGTLTSLKRRFEKLLDPDRHHITDGPAAIDRFSLLAAIWVLGLSAVLSFVVYERHPHVQDEVIYLYQARYFANGELTAPAAAVHQAFSIYMIPYEDDRWYSPFPPGWPAVLALGIRMGVPWLVNPVLAALSVLLLYLLLLELYSRFIARVAVLLVCASPWFVFMGMNYMSHTLTLACALAAAVSLVRARTTNKAIWGWLAGFAVGALSLVRLLDGLAVAVLLGLWALGVGGRRLKAASFAGLIIGALAVSALVLPYNRILTGSPMTPPLVTYYEKYHGPGTNSFGFGPGRGLGWALDAYPGHSPVEAVINAGLNAFSVNVELFGWSAGSLFIIAIMLVSGTMRRSDWLMLSAIIAVVGLYSLYWFNGGPDFGARYWYLAVIPCVALAARGIEYIAGTAKSGFGDSALFRTGVIAGALAMSLSALVNYFPWRSIDKYHHYLRMRPDIPRLAREQRFGKSLVLIRGTSHPDYQSAWIYNPLDLSDDVPVYAWDRDPLTRSDVLKAYPDRPVWIVDGPTRTGRGFEISAGPMSAQELANSHIAER